MLEPARKEKHEGNRDFLDPAQNAAGCTVAAS